MLTGKQQVFVAPGNEFEQMLDTDLPWVDGHVLHVPLEHWEMLLAEARLLDAAMASLLERASGTFSPENRFMELSTTELHALRTFSRRLANWLRARPAMSADPPEDLDYVLPPTDYAQLAAAFVAVLDEAVRTGAAFEAWTEW